MVVHFTTLAAARTEEEENNKSLFSSVIDLTQ